MRATWHRIWDPPPRAARHLALALSSGDAELADLFRRNMSLRRWSDMESERARIGEVEPKTAEAARRAVLFRLQGLLAEEDEDVGNVRDE